MILDTYYKNYDNALKVLKLDNLKDRRQHLYLAFAKKMSQRSPKKLFPTNNRTHPMSPREYEYFQVLKVNTDRFSPIIHWRINWTITQKEELKKTLEYLNSWLHLLLVNSCGISSYCCQLITEIIGLGVDSVKIYGCALMLAMRWLLSVP